LRINSAATTSYSYAETSYANPHAATSIGGTSLTYDNNGNVSGYGSKGYVWDYKNRLLETGNGSASSTFVYDYNLNRIKRVADGVTTYFPNDLYNAANSTSTKQIFAGGMLVATVEGNGNSTTTRYDHADQLASVNVITDSIGNEVQTLDYYPFGEKRINHGNTTSQRQFIGEEFDSQSNLNYLNARYYDAARGQFLSEDPVFWEESSNQSLGNPQSLNSYSYSDNNPINRSDPSGRFSINSALRTIATALQSLLRSLSNYSNSSIAQKQSENQNIKAPSNSSNNANTILSPSSWVSQMPDPYGCFDKCVEMAGYKPSGQIDIAKYDANGNLKSLPNAKGGASTIDQYLSNGSPVIVGVNRGDKVTTANNNNATEHFVVINGSNYDDKGKYYTFFDPGTSRQDAGTSPSNRLYVNPDSSLSGTTQYNGANYMVTEIKTK
jgi:RHS repeat-associated protein